MREWLHEAERIYYDPMLAHRRGNASEIDISEYIAWSYYLVSFYFQLHLRQSIQKLTD